MTTSTLTWYNPNDTFLTQSQALNNAQIVANHFSGTDWTKESLSALCGNMWHESSINPSMHELGYGDSMSYGYGLVQWTPGTKLSDWCSANGLDYTQGDSQLARIDYEVNNNIQWIAKSTYGNTSFADFRRNAGGWSVDYLTEMFMNCYERPASATANLADRQSFANTAYTSLDWTGTGGTVTPSNLHGQTVVNKANYQYEEKGALGMYIVVKAGDNLSTIANHYGVNVNDIKQVSFSEITNKNVISVGEVLLVPNVPAQAPAKPAVTSPVYYWVAAGDNLTKIASKYGTNVKQLQAWNDISNPNLIKIGQRLRVQ